MARAEDRVVRMDDIERKLANAPDGLTTGQLALRYGVNRSTIHRDVREMERRGTGLVKDGRRWKLDHRRSLYSVKFTPYELVALFLAARLLSRHSDERNPHVVCGHGWRRGARCWRRRGRWWRHMRRMRAVL